jgi:hypothetical protein
VEVISNSTTMYSRRVSVVQRWRTPAPESSSSKSSSRMVADDAVPRFLGPDKPGPDSIERPIGRIAMER